MSTHPPIPAELSTRERTRTTKACVACSIRKIKCDGGNPCAHCVRFFAGECFYTTPKKRGPPKGCPARGGHRKRQALAAEAEAAAPSNPTSVPNGARSSARAEPLPTPPNSTSVNVPSIESSMGLSLDGSEPYPRMKESPNSNNNPAFSDLLLSNLAMRNDLSFPPVVPAQHHQRPQSSHQDSNSDSMFRSPQSSSSQHSPLSYLPPPLRKQTSAFSPRNPLLLPPSPPMPSQATRTGLTSQAIDELLTVFETFIHPHWPIIYMPALRSLRSLETQSPMVFDAIIAISAANADLEPGPGGATLTVSSNAAELSAACDYLAESVRQRVLEVITHRDLRPTLQHVQSLMFVAMCDVGCGRKPLGYQMSGIACRMAVEIGLHTRLPSVSAQPRDPRETQERSRTVWACYVLDKILAAVSQRPPCMRLIDIDTPRPSTMESDELDLWLAGKPQVLLAAQSYETMICVKSHTLSSFNAWCDVMTILELIIDQVYRPSTRHARMDGHLVDGYDESVIHIDAELRKWRASLSPNLQWSDEDEHAHHNTGLHLLTCRGWYYICLLLLHRPQVPYLDTNVNSADGNSDFNRSLVGVSDPYQSATYRLPNALDVCRHSATSICKIMEAFHDTFRFRRFASSWVYLSFQAGTVFAGLAAHDPSVDDPIAAIAGYSPSRTESLRRLEECITWLDQISLQWASASRHVEILRKLSAVGGRTRPPSPLLRSALTTGNDPSYLALGSFNGNNGDHGQQGNNNNFDNNGALDQVQTALPAMTSEDLDAWMMLWASMPTAGDDINLWQQCFPPTNTTTAPAATSAPS